MNEVVTFMLVFTVYAKFKCTVDYKNDRALCLSVHRCGKAVEL